MTRLHAVRVAARVRRELNVDVAVIGGPYGRFQVLVDGVPVVDGGRIAMLGILPSGDKVVEAVRTALGVA